MYTFNEGIGMGSFVLWKAYRAYCAELDQHANNAEQTVTARGKNSSLRQQIGETVVRFGRSLQGQPSTVTAQSQ